MIRSILVPLDGSSFGEQALPLALEVARRAQAAVQLIHVHQPVASPWSGSEWAANLNLESEVRQQEQEYLRETAARLGRESAVPVTSDLLEGPVVEVIHERVLGCGADLVVMATHGRGPLSRFWLGSVADQLIRRVAAPLLLVRPHPGGTPPPAVVRHVLVPLDGSEQAEQVLGPALDLAALLAADVTLLRVVEPLVVPDRHWAGNAVSGVDPDLVHRLAADARGYLERVVISLDGAAPRIAPQVVVNRRAADTILAETGAHPGTLVALATHARAGLARLVLGSVADKVIRGTTGPVLVYRPLAS
jgi:nucleotide-binding universal stress UspA family protein